SAKLGSCVRVFAHYFVSGRAPKHQVLNTSQKPADLLWLATTCHSWIRLLSNPCCPVRFVFLPKPITGLKKGSRAKLCAASSTQWALSRLNVATTPHRLQR